MGGFKNKENDKNVEKEENVIKMINEYDKKRIILQNKLENI